MILNEILKETPTSNFSNNSRIRTLVISLEIKHSIYSAIKPSRFIALFPAISLTQVHYHENYTEKTHSGTKNTVFIAT